MPVRFSFLYLLLSIALCAQPYLHPAIPAGAEPSAHFDAEAATDAWLHTVPVEKRSQSDAYFEGDCWLLLWNFLYAAAILLLLLELRISARLRDVAVRLTNRFWLQAFCYSLAVITAAASAELPLTVYQGFFRERAYGLLNQAFGSWCRDQCIGFLVVIAVGASALAAFMLLARRSPRGWPFWATLISICFLVLGVMVVPIWISPVFNTYKPLPDSPIRRQILSLARANGIPAIQVDTVDESRQSKRVSANVSGLWGTERITLNDNLLNRCSAAGVLSTMGHEMGHYVLHHVYAGVLFSSLITAMAFAVLSWVAPWATRHWGRRWQVKSLDDIAVLPLILLVLLALNFLLLPVLNTYTRVQEYEADLYGLNAAREPDGEAEVDLLLGEYRKLDPTPLEEFLFFDHPSGRRRIYAAMRWKGENLCLFDRQLACSGTPSASRPSVETRNVQTRPPQDVQPVR